jgi:hypothetical protein
MHMRLGWNVKRSGPMVWRASSMAGISVSIVVFELGTIWQIRKLSVIWPTPPSRDARLRRVDKSLVYTL